MLGCRGWFAAVGSAATVTIRIRLLARHVQAHVAAAFGPLVVLLGQHRADQADQRVAAGEDPDHVGAAADLLVQPFLRVVRPDLPPDLPRVAGEGQQLVAGVVEVRGRVAGTWPSSASTTRSYCARTASASACSKIVRTWVATMRLGRLGHPGEQVAQVVGTAALPGRPGQRGADRGDQPGWASEMTSCTPDRPRATSPRRNASQPAPSSAEATSRPRISRCPSALTPVAIRRAR